MPYRKQKEYLQDIYAKGEMDSDDLVAIGLEDGTNVYIRQTEQDGMGSSDWIVDPALTPDCLSSHPIAQKQGSVITVEHGAATDEKLMLSLRHVKGSGFDSVVSRATFVSASTMASFTPVRRSSTTKADEIDGLIKEVASH